MPRKHGRGLQELDQKQQNAQVIHAGEANASIGPAEHDVVDVEVLAARRSGMAAKNVNV
jgi:hypothetical protein